MRKFDELLNLKSGTGFVHRGAAARMLFAPDLGARVFCELSGITLHRVDLDNVRDPNRTFNNYGGNNFWPAPEGGRFGFNYEGDTWRVQPAVNNEPFALRAAAGPGAQAFKQTVLTNRLGTRLEVAMQREFMPVPVPALVASLGPAAALAYTVDDRIDVRGSATAEEALVACWTLEQFDATSSTVAFAKVGRPREAINFDYYEHPGDRITYAPTGFLYRTDSRKRGQIGINKDFAPEWVGFFDLARKLLCVREIVGRPEGVYFNIADNDQPEGPFSARDAYSVFNGEAGMDFFELETIGGMHVENGSLKGSRLLSRTSFALFEQEEPIRRFLSDTIGA